MLGNVEAQCGSLATAKCGGTRAEVLVPGPPEQDTLNLTSFLSFLSLVQQQGQRDDADMVKCEKRNVFQLVGCWELENRATKVTKTRGGGEGGRMGSRPWS